MNFEQIINSGALSEDAITQETQQKVQDLKFKEESQFSDEDRSNSDDSDSSNSDDSAQGLFIKCSAFFFSKERIQRN